MAIRSARCRVQRPIGETSSQPILIADRSPPREALAASRRGASSREFSCKTAGNCCNPQVRTACMDPSAASCDPLPAISWQGDFSAAAEVSPQACERHHSSQTGVNNTSIASRQAIPRLTTFIEKWPMRRDYATPLLGSIREHHDVASASRNTSFSECLRIGCFVGCAASPRRNSRRRNPA